MSAAFRTLSLGLGPFKNKDPVQEQIFTGAAASKSNARSKGPSSAQQASSSSIALPAELDFFAAPSKPVVKPAASSQRSSSPDLASKKRKRKDATKSASASNAGPSSPKLDSPDAVKSFLRKYRLNVTGTDFPTPLVDWQEASYRYEMPSWMVDELHQERQWELTGIQRAALPVALERRDLLAMAPTGSGKTLAYLIPLLHHLLQAKAKSNKESASTPGPRALILSPTRELATQIYDEIRRLLQSSPDAKAQDTAEQATSLIGQANNGKKKAKKGGRAAYGGLRVALLTGGEKLKPIEDSDQGSSSTGGRGAKFDIVISTPLRLVKAIESEGWTLSNVSQVILDEADTLLSEAFISQTDALLAQCTATQLQKSLFSATLPSSVEALSRSFLSPDCVRIIVGSKDASSEDVDQELRFVGSEEGKILELRTMLKTGQVKPPALLFVQSIERAKDLYSELVYDGLRLDAIHSERTRTQREQVIASFKRGDVWLLICTEVLSRGLDFKGVELVINYDLPQSAESYVHRVGRTGRAGRQGKAITFFTKDDAAHLPTIVNLVKRSSPKALENIPQYLLQIPKVGKKQKKKLRTKAPQREAVSEASGSRTLERDRAERKQGKRLLEKKKRTAGAEGEQKTSSSKKQKQRKKAKGTAAVTADEESDESISGGSEIGSGSEED